MSLQVQSSQQPTSGRRTPQIYQNFGSPGTASSTNGSNAGNTKSSTKLSLKTSSGKQSPSVETTTMEPAPKDSPKSSSPAPSKLSISTSSTPKHDKAEKEKEVKSDVTNGSTNGNKVENVTNGKHEEVATPVKPAPGSPKKEEEKDKKKETPKTSVQAAPQKQPTESIPVEQPKTPDYTGKKSKESPLVTPDQKKKDKPAVESSLVAEKTLKGFTAEGDEMESLVVEPSEYEDSPMPPRTGGKTKLLKYGSGPPTRARVSPFRVNEPTANVSTAVNLSTVSEGQNSAPESNEASPAIDFNRPLRTISGRRSTRPITDIHFTYRKSVDLNDSLSSSLNVTVGSEIHNDSVRTPAPGSSRKRKAMTPESTSDALDVKEVCESPKRGRLDFSGLLGIVSSPVTLLKNRLSRVRLHASTPVAKRNLEEENLNTCVTAEATTTTANISGEATKMETDEEKKVENVEKADDEQKAEGTLEEAQTNLPESAEKAKDDGSGDLGEPVEVKDVTNKQRQFCVVM